MGDSNTVKIRVNGILTKQNLESDSDVCNDCQQIDFQRAFNLDPATLHQEKDLFWKGILIANLGLRHKQAPGKNCALCKMFSAFQFSDETPECRRELRAYSLIGSMVYDANLDAEIPKSLQSHDQIYLAVDCAPSHIYSHSDRATTTQVYGGLHCARDDEMRPGLFSPCRIPAQFDPAPTIRMLEYCKANHTGRCNHRDTTQVQGFKLIDCKSLTVVLALPTTLYVALSYVWRKQSDTTSTATTPPKHKIGSLPASLSSTIKDAISVTKMLGFQYLWVDKYCIDQDNPTHKLDQINKMDVIYKAAEITIIAAAGEDEDFGLPGVGSTRRIPQPTATIGDITIFSTMKDPRMSIVWSKWRTRGWTYQEAVLSPRRLVFNEEQTYFECNTVNCQESIAVDLDLFSSKDADRCRHSGLFSGRSRGFCGGGEKSPLIGLETYQEHVCNYSKRDLTFEEDSLKAFVGIARHMQLSEAPIYHVWGLPSLQPVAQSPYQRVTYDIWSLGHALGWYHHVYMTESIGRREAFPSWSWAGWSGPVAFPSLEMQVDDFVPLITLAYREALPLPSKIPVRSIKTKSALNEASHSICLSILCVEAFICYPETISPKNPPNTMSWDFCGHFAYLYLSNDQRTYAQLMQAVEDRTFRFLLLGEYPKSTTCTFMVIEDFGSFASRVGFLEVRSFSFASLRRDWQLEKRIVCLI
jgi:hypothetical protein